MVILETDAVRETEFQDIFPGDPHGLLQSGRDRLVPCSVLRWEVSKCRGFADL